MTMYCKTCSKCGESKELTEFFRDSRNNKEGRRAECKECTTKRTTITRKLSKSKYNETVNERNKRKKLEAIEYLGGKCADCGYVGHQSVYDFHHLDPNEKEGNPSAMLRKTNWKEEIDKCVLLCANCHRLRHHGEE